MLTGIPARFCQPNHSGWEQPLPEPEDGLLDMIERLVGFEPGDGGVNLRELRRALANLPSSNGRAVSLWGDEELTRLVGRAEAIVFAHLGRPKDNYIHQPRFYTYLDHAIFFTKRIVEGNAETVSWNGWH